MNNLQDKNNEFEDVEDKSEGKSIKGINSVSTPDLSIDTIISRWKNGILRMPDFQRKFVWTLEQSSRFIESLLLKVPIPSLMFYQDANANQLIVDGQQRIKSIIYFIGDDSIDTNNLPKEECHEFTKRF